MAVTYLDSSFLHLANDPNKFEKIRLTDIQAALKRGSWGGEDDTPVKKLDTKVTKPKGRHD
jgi:hypothetical protein